MGDPGPTKGTNLEVFNACALILSFYGYSDQVLDLLQALSKRTRHYFICHKDILFGFLTQWPKTPKTNISFGGDASGSSRD